jgi:2-polyprenyl-6-methoxyphenol hydroxylase-like FAD-dependent oxidoreductase
MKIVCIGGGPAGLYFAISAKLRDPAHQISVIERSGAGVTYGWGVVYWDNLLDMLFNNDMESARQIRAASRLWQEQDIRVGDNVAYLAGYGYSMTRAALIEILADRARALGIEVIFNQPTDDLAAYADADIIVGADGATSTVRGLREREFGTQLRGGHNRYMWLGTRKVFDRFTFAHELTDAGWLWFHAYPSSSETSTCIVECTEATWRAHGFGEHQSVTDTMGVLEKIFHRYLDGHPLISQSRGQTAHWQQFLEVTNATWCHQNVVLIGDAAHTTHFTLGSGTRLALIDAVALAQSIYENPTAPGAALRMYEQRRRPALQVTQATARASMAWFENIDHYLDQDVTNFAYAMASRQGEEPFWRYQQHLANQIPPVRAGRRHYHSAQRLYLAARRGQLPLVPLSLLRTLNR